MLKYLQLVTQPLTVPWASAACDSARLKALVRRPDPTATLYALSSSTSTYPVLLCDRKSDLGQQFLVFGHAKACAEDYAPLLEAVASLGLPAVRFTGLPSAASAAAKVAFAADYRELYNTPCRQCTLSQQRARADARTREASDGLPDGYILAPLSPEDAEIVNDRWPYKVTNGDKSLHHIADIIARNCTASVRDSASHAPVCWIVENDDGSMGMLHTEPEHRRRGLGRVCVRFLLRQLLEQRQQQQQQQGDGVDDEPLTYCYVVGSNNASLGLLQSVGFVMSQEETYTWQGFGRQTLVNSNM